MRYEGITHCRIHSKLWDANDYPEPSMRGGWWLCDFLCQINWEIFFSLLILVILVSCRSWLSLQKSYLTLPQKRIDNLTMNLIQITRLYRFYYEFRNLLRAQHRLNTCSAWLSGSGLNKNIQLIFHVIARDQCRCVIAENKIKKNLSKNRIERVTEKESDQKP